MGIVTASMPSFARMLHHHLPPWKQLKSRLPFHKTTTRTKSSQRSRSHVMRLSTAAKLRWEENEIPYNSRFPSVSLERGSVEEDEERMYPRLEMNSLTRGKIFITGVRHQRADEEGLFLKSDVEHTWSTRNAANAFDHEKH